MFKKIGFIFLVSFFLVGCMTSPTGRSQFILMPDAQVNQMGLEAFDTLKKEKKISTSSQYSQLAHCISQAIVSEQGGNWEVVVFEDKSPNAFALPGNKIGIYTGMIALVDNQEQLAAVIGHEVGHVLAKHSNERASQEMAVSQGMAIIQAIGSPQSTLGQTAFGLLGVGTEYGILMPY
ncbi:MAG: M48 family metalloprotease, partial [Actinobacteria bacterium]|nr:M48 family metalloprotease [Actinomycetota bacterium]